MSLGLISKNFFLLLILVVLLPACGRRDVCYFPPLEPACSVICDEKNLELAVTLLAPDDCYAYFGVQAQGYCPLQVQITNKGGDTYVLRPSYLDLKRDSGKAIAKTMHYDTYMRCAFMTVVSLIFWWEAIPFIVIPYGFYWRNKNKKITHHILTKSLRRDENLTIGPYEMVTKFIFVPENGFKRSFDIKFFNNETGGLVSFVVDLADMGVHYSNEQKLQEKTAK